MRKEFVITKSKEMAIVFNQEYASCTQQVFRYALEGNGTSARDGTTNLWVSLRMLSWDSPLFITQSWVITGSESESDWIQTCIHSQLSVYIFITLTGNHSCVNKLHLFPVQYPGDGASLRRITSLNGVTEKLDRVSWRIVIGGET